MFSKSRMPTMTIVPVRPAVEAAPAPETAGRGLLRRTFGRGNPSRRTFGRYHP